MPPLRTYIRYGPDAGGNSFARRVLGVLLWWRLWAQLVVLFAGMAVIGLYLPEGAGAGFIVGLLSATFASMFAADRYGITVGGEPS